MSITLPVSTILDADPRYLDHQFCLRGVLLFSRREFLLYHLDQEGNLAETRFVRIDDWIAAEKLCEVLDRVPPDRWCYFGEALVRAFVRVEGEERVLHTLQEIDLLEPTLDRKYILVRGEGYWR